MKYIVLIAGGLLLAACSSGRSEQEGSFLDPVCMPDGSVVYYQYAKADGSFDPARGSKANCPWNRGK